MPAEKDEDYVFNLAREVTAFYERYPAYKSKIYFIDMSRKAQLIGYDEIEGADILSRLGQNDDFIPQLKDVYANGSKTVPYTDLGYACVIMNTLKDRLRVHLLGTSSSEHLDNVFTFDHEVAHALCTEKGDSEYKAECVADAYAVLRYIQRFPKDHDALKNLAGIRAVTMLFSPDQGAHFTSPIVQQIINISATVDFTTLTPEQTQKAALQYAQFYAIPEEDAARISGVFAFLQQPGIWTALFEGSFNIIEYIAEKTLATQDAKVFKWGALALRTILSGELSCSTLQLYPQGPKWDKLRADLDKREAEWRQRQPVRKPRGPGQG